MNKYKKTIKKALENGPDSMCNTWRDWIKERHPELFWEFKVGDWLISIDKSDFVKFEKYGSYGTFTSSESYGNAKDNKGWVASRFKKATKEEIETYLIAEARRRGFKRGTRIVNTLFYDGTYHCPEEQGFKVMCSGKLKYDEHCDALYYKNIEYPLEKYLRIYCKGVWADIIETEEISIKKAEELLEELSGGKYKINCG